MGFTSRYPHSSGLRMKKPRSNTPLMSALGCQSGYNIAGSENLPPSICLAEDLTPEDDEIKDFEPGGAYDQRENFRIEVLPDGRQVVTSLGNV